MSQIFDLFGDPVPDNWGRRGRPQHIATRENCNKVMMLLALGRSNERIAKAMGITSPTLRRNYFRVLKFREEQRDRMEARLAMKLWEGVEAGNVAAIREFVAFVERNDMMTYGQTPSDVRAPKLGKKEQALVDARSPDTETTLGELMARRQSDQPN